MNRQTIFNGIFVLGLLAPSSLTAQEAKEPTTLRVYFIGNSVTDTINYRGLEALAKSRGHKHIWGRHMIPGAPLQWIWQHPDQGFQEQPYGHYPTALTKFQWDVLCLQPFDRHITGDEGDIVMAKNFIKMALTKSPDLQVYKDGIHLNDVGSYIVACTFFATLYGENPEKLTTEPYAVIDPKATEVIRDVVWNVVKGHELAGLRK